MGKIRIKTLGDEEKEKKQKKQDVARREGKKLTKLKGKGGGRIVEMEGVETLSEDEKPGNTETQNISVSPKISAPQRSRKTIRKQKRSGRYLKARSFVDKTKTYSLDEAIALVKKTNVTKFDATMEVHVNTLVKDIKGRVTLPHGIGKEIKVAVADDRLLAQVEAGKIDFDVLISHPSFMAKLAKVAKILGPKGLMPNPKNGTISENPIDLAKKFSSALHFKTEADFPLIHSVIGKTNFPDNKLAENLNVLIKAIGVDKIKTLYLKATMSPSVKVAIVKENNL